MSWSLTKRRPPSLMESELMKFWSASNRIKKPHGWDGTPTFMNVECAGFMSAAGRKTPKQVKKIFHAA